MAHAAWRIEFSLYKQFTEHASLSLESASRYYSTLVVSPRLRKLAAPKVELSNKILAW